MSLVSFLSLVRIYYSAFFFKILTLPLLLFPLSLSLSLFRANLCYPITILDPIRFHHASCFILHMHFNLCLSVCFVLQSSSLLNDSNAIPWRDPATFFSFQKHTHTPTLLLLVLLCQNNVQLFRQWVHSFPLYATHYKGECDLNIKHTENNSIPKIRLTSFLPFAAPGLMIRGARRCAWFTIMRGFYPSLVVCYVALIQARSTV